jgi:hypothetical protein
MFGVENSRVGLEYAPGALAGAADAETVAVLAGLVMGSYGTTFGVENSRVGLEYAPGAGDEAAIPAAGALDAGDVGRAAMPAAGLGAVSDVAEPAAVYRMGLK